ncbi:MAG: AraC family transcriptional regulator, partial [Catalinimonas sp.]
MSTSLRALTERPAGRPLDRLVENRRCYTVDVAELNLYDALRPAERVWLRFDAPVLASMITGQKVMHLRDHRPFDFWPGESLVLPAGEPMHIDFPDASDDAPTRCLALALSEELIRETCVLLEEHCPRAEPGDAWALDDRPFHLMNDPFLHDTVRRLVQLFVEDHPARDLFVRQTSRELVVRLLQTHARRLLVD